MNFLQSRLRRFYLLCVSSVLYALGWVYAVCKVYKWGWDVLTGGPSVLRWKKRDVPPDILRSSRWGTHRRVRLKNGVCLHYVERGSRKLPLLVLLHGFPEFWFSFRYQLEGLCDQYWTVAVDLPGFGESDKPQSKDMGIQQTVQDIALLMSALGRTRCFLVGHDYGAVICWRLAALYPHLIYKFVILNGPHPRHLAYICTKSWRQLHKFSYMLIYQTGKLPEIDFRLKDYRKIQELLLGGKQKCEQITAEDIEAYKYTLGTDGSLRSALSVWQHLVAEGWAAEKMIYVPVLLVWGDQDPIMSPELVALMQRGMPGLTVNKVPGGGHCIQQQMPALVNAAIRDFMYIGRVTIKGEK